MHVVRHHHPGEKTIKMPLAVSDQNGTGHDVGNPRVAKLAKPPAPPKQVSLHREESHQNVETPESVRRAAIQELSDF